MGEYAFSSGGDLAKIFDQTLTADTASIDTGTTGFLIPSGYSALQILMLTRTDDAAATHAIDFTVNNDGASGHYDNQYITASSTNVSGAASAAQNTVALDSHGSGGTANYAAFHNILIPAYSQTTFYKVMNILENFDDTTGANSRILIMTATFRSTAAITRVAVAAQSTAKLKSGSRLTVYGLP